MKVNLFLIGAMRAGSTTLYNYLKQHPEIFVLPVKEPYFFTAEYYRGLLENEEYNNSEEKLAAECFIQSGQYRTKERYNSLFKHAQGFKYIGEASHYIHHPNTAKLIYRYNPNSKIIVTLRNPIERVFSEYKFRLRRGQIKLSFHDFLMTGLKWENGSWKVLKGSGLPKGFYSYLLEPWMGHFGAKNVKICLFKDLIKNPVQTCSDIFFWLNINSEFRPVILRAQRSGKPRSLFINKILLSQNPIYDLLKKVIPDHMRIQLRDNFYRIMLKSVRMDQESREILRNIYSSDILTLERMIQRDLSHWK